MSIVDFVIIDPSQGDIHFKVSGTQSLGKIAEAYCERMDLPPNKIALRLPRAKKIFSSTTTTDVETLLKNGDRLEVMVRKTSK